MESDPIDLPLICVNRSLDSMHDGEDSSVQSPLVLNATHRPEMLLSLAVVLGGVNLASG
jgi:hypothetical protein